MGSTAFAGKEAPPAAARPSAAGPPEPEWTVAITDDQHEEMDTPEIVALFAAGTIDAETFVWKEGMDDWLTPFEIPAIAEALTTRGLGPEGLPNASPPRAGQPSGVWREPGRWNEPGVGAIVPKADVTFDDVTVAMAVPEAEALFRAAEAGELAPPSRSPGATPYADAPPDLGDEPSNDDVTVMRPGLSAYGDEPSNEDVTVAVASPLLAARSAGFAPRPRRHAEAPTAERTPRPAPPAAPFFDDAAPTDLFPPSPSRASQPDDHDAHLTGARNESSVLFSLDALAKQASTAPAQRTERVGDDELLGAPPRRRDAPPDSLANLGGGGLLAAPDFSAPVAEAPPAFVPDVPVSSAEPAAVPARKGNGGVIAVLLVLLLVAAAIVAGYVLKIPRSLFPAAASTAEVPSALAPAASAPADTASAAPPASASAVAPAPAARPTPPPRPSRARRRESKLRGRNRPRPPGSRSRRRSPRPQPSPPRRRKPRVPRRRPAPLHRRSRRSIAVPLRRPWAPPRVRRPAASSPTVRLEAGGSP